MIQVITSAFSETTQCIMVIAATIFGVWMYQTQGGLCDKTLGKATKSRCDNTKRIAFGALCALLALMVKGYFMGGGYGGGYAGAYAG
jgi:hypothetical protein